MERSEYWRPVQSFWFYGMVVNLSTKGTLQLDYLLVSYKKKTRAYSTF